MSSRVRLSVLCVVILAMPVFAAQSRRLDLSGTWMASGDRVVMTQTPGQLGATYKPPHKCTSKGTIITELFNVPYTEMTMVDGTITGNLSGEITLCTGVEKLMTDCGLPEVYQAVFAGFVQGDTIEVSYRPDYVNFKEKDGHWTNCSVKPGGAADLNRFTITRGPQHKSPPLHQKR